MPIVCLSGDLFANEYGVEAYAHGCNCQGSMGAGIAVGFRQRYPKMYEEYRKQCKATPRRFNPGDVFLWKSNDQPWVFNLATQEAYRRRKATNEAVEQALAGMRTVAQQEGVESIAMPRIGAGLGELDWNGVRSIIERTYAGWPGTLYVYDEYVPAGGPPSCG